MTYHIRRSGERKYFDHGWLRTYHTFSFGSYYDPNFMGFRDLKVINEDRVEGGRGFPMHAHQDMEILSIILEGDLGHQDSMGNKSVIHANEVQAMSAGTGITHSEYNPSNVGVHFLQIWIQPDTKGLAPRYQQSKLPASANQWVLIASQDGRDNALKIHQDVWLYAISLDSGKEAEQEISSTRYGWVQVVDGEISMHGETLQAGDGAAIESATQLTFKALSPARILFFDLK